MFLALVLLASSAQADVTTHIGAGLRTTLALDRVSAPTADAAFRLGLGRSVLTDLAVGGGMVSDHNAYTSRSLEDDGSSTLSSHDSEERTGLFVEASTRWLFRVSGEEEGGFFVGAMGALCHERASGPWTIDEDNDDGDTVKVEVGESVLEETGWTVGPAFTVVHPLSDRLSISGLVDFEVFSRSARTETRRRTTDGAAVDMNVWEDDEQSVGLFPRIGLQVFLRL